MEDEDDFMNEIFVKLQTPFASPRVNGSVESLRNTSGSSFEFSHGSTDTSYCSQCSSCGTSPRNDVKSSITFHQRPILPPLICASYRQEMRSYRDKAVERDQRRKSAEKQRLITRVEAILSSVKFTPKAKKKDQVIEEMTHEATSTVEPTPSSDEERTVSTVIEVQINSLDVAVESLVTEAIVSAKQKLADTFNHTTLSDHELEQENSLSDGHNEEKSKKENVEPTKPHSPDISIKHDEEVEPLIADIDSFSPIQLRCSIENETLNQSTSTKVHVEDCKFETIPLVANSMNIVKKLPEGGDAPVHVLKDEPVLARSVELSSISESIKVLENDEITQNPIFLSNSEAEDTTIAESCSVPMGTSESEATLLHDKSSDDSSDITMKLIDGAGDTAVATKHRRRGSYTLDTPSPFLIRSKEKHTFSVTTDESCSEPDNVSVTRKLEMDSESDESSMKSSNVEGSDCVSMKDRLQLIHRKQLSELQRRHKMQMVDIQMKLLKNQRITESKTAMDEQSITSEDSLLPLDVRKDLSFLQLPKISTAKTPSQCDIREQPVIEVYSPENKKVEFIIHENNSPPQKLQNMKNEATNDFVQSRNDKVAPSLHKNFCKLSALIKGHLTRCLLATQKVQGVMEKVRDTTCLILAIQEDRSGVSKSDEDDQLQQRLFSQFFDLLDEIHRIFFDTDVSYRMKLIASSEAKIIRKMKKKQPMKLSRTLSAATKKSMERKQRQQCESPRPQSTKPRTEVRSRISHIWKESKVSGDVKSESSVSKPKHEPTKNVRSKPKVISNSAKTIKPDTIKHPAAGSSKTKIVRKKAPLSTRNAISPKSH